MAFQTALVALLLLTGAKQSPALVCKEYADAQPIAELQRPVRADLVVAAGGLGMMDAWMRTNVAAAADAIGSVLDHVRRGEMWSWMDEVGFPYKQLARAHALKAPGYGGPARRRFGCLWQARLFRFVWLG